MTSLCNVSFLPSREYYKEHGTASNFSFLRQTFVQHAFLQILELHPAGVVEMKNVLVIQAWSSPAEEPQLRRPGRFARHGLCLIFCDTFSRHFVSSFRVHVLFLTPLQLLV